ncbi:MAG: isoprenyl transferase [Eubacterium sp.]|nr:isoprenyl transferase [Eubacterium sp.]
MEKEINGTIYRIPRHVSIILDGNGRWAKKHLMPRNFGHTQGAKVVEQICEDAWDLGIQYLTVYAFSTENWKRPEKEVRALMRLLRKYLVDCIERTSKNNMRVRVIGEKSRLDQDIRDAIEELERVSSVNTGLNFTIALNYGSRDEMIRTVRAVSKDVKEGLIDPENISEELFSSRLDTAELPDPDLMIRTSGETRLSNWMLWQLAYAEFYFTDVLWPDFNKEELIRAIAYYNTRDRRFGGV